MAKNLIKNKKISKLHKKSKTSSWLGVRLKTYIPQLLVFFGLILTLFSLTHWYLRNQALSLNKTLLSEYEHLYSQKVAKRQQYQPVDIQISNLVNTTIEPHLISNGTWSVSPNKASYLVQSAVPGEAGNIILYGHNKQNIFGNLPSVKNKDIIMLTLKDGTKVSYQVFATHQVSPKDIQYIQPTDHEILTIYTCSGFLDKDRFIVQAKRL